MGHTVRRIRSAAGVLLLVLGGLAVGTSRPADATPLAPFIDLQERGLALVGDAAGVAGGFDATGVDLTVEVGGPVRFALLYWGGTLDCAVIGDPCSDPALLVAAQPIGDQEVTFGGTDLTGTITGAEEQPVTGRLHVGFFADVTGIVSAAGPGTRTFPFADGDAADLLAVHGAALLVGYTDPADLAFHRVLIQDGADFGLGSDPAPPPPTTDPTDPDPAPEPEDPRSIESVTLVPGIGLVDRTAEVLVVVGGGTGAGRDVVTAGPVTVEGGLDADDGATIDLDRYSVPLPAGTGTIPVEVTSPADGGDPLLALVVAARVEQPDPVVTTCTATVAAGPPAQAQITIEDDGAGLLEIVVTESANADTVVPPFLPGTTDPVVVTATKIDQSQRMSIAIRVTDAVGDVTLCPLQSPNLAPTVTLGLTPDPATATEPGGDVDFQVLVTNTSDETVELTALEDDVLGDLGGEGTCGDAVGTVLAPDETYACTYTDEVVGDGGDVEVRTGTVTVEDLDILAPLEGEASDTASVAIGAAPTTSTSTTSTTSSTTSTTLATTTSTTAAVGSGALSRTGGDPVPLTSTAGALLAAGGVALLLGDRRRRPAR